MMSYGGYFMDRARAGGYDVIDMQPVFVDHYRSHEQPFNWRFRHQVLVKRA